MSKIVLEIPDEIGEAVRLPAAERPARLRRELALRLYEKGLISFGKARQLAGLSVRDFHRLLGEEEIPRSYDREELEHDLRALDTPG